MYANTFNINVPFKWTIHSGTLRLQCLMTAVMSGKQLKIIKWFSGLTPWYEGSWVLSEGGWWFACKCFATQLGNFFNANSSIGPVMRPIGPNRVGIFIIFGHFQDMVDTIILERQAVTLENNLKRVVDCNWQTKDWRGLFRIYYKPTYFNVDGLMQAYSCFLWFPLKLKEQFKGN